MLFENSRVAPQKTLKYVLPYDTAILLLDIYQKELKAESQRKVCTPMFIPAFVIVSKGQKQTKYPSMDNLINSM